MGRGLRAEWVSSIRSVQNQGAGPVSDCEPHGLERMPSAKVAVFHVEQRQRLGMCFTWNTTGNLRALRPS